jgi:sugar phosphate isomerase/epimerase
MSRRIPRGRLGVQIHSLRAEVASDFGRTLNRLCELGIGSLELCHFPGFAGNPWGDFGETGRWPARRIGTLLAEAGMHCVATHCMHRDLAPDRLDATIAWVRAVGSPAIVLAGFPAAADADLDTWRANFAWLNGCGRRLADDGLGFAYHTQAELWQDMGDALLANEFFRLVNPARCAMELDPSGSIVHNSDWSRPVLQHPNRYLAFHLRDGRRPDRPVPYLPALPLGDGDTDWPRTVEVALEAGIREFLLEMEVEDPQQVFPAIESSLDYLESLDLVA